MSCETPAIQPKVCQCALVNPFLADRMAYTCQWKVNSEMMKMDEYFQICEEEKEMIAVSNSERQRLEKIWTKRGYKWRVDKKTGDIHFLDSSPSPN